MYGKKAVNQTVIQSSVSKTYITTYVREISSQMSLSSQTSCIPIVCYEKFSGLSSYSNELELRNRKCA